MKKNIQRENTCTNICNFKCDMHEYIENSIDGDLNLDNLKSVDFSNMGTSQIVEDALRDALSVFEKYYGEEQKCGFGLIRNKRKKPDGEWKDAYVFSINRKQYSTIFTNITNSWYRMESNADSRVTYEDLFIIGLSIFAFTFISRRRFKNCWTRDINVSIRYWNMINGRIRLTMGKNAWIFNGRSLAYCI